MNQYSRKQILDWFIVMNRAEIQLNDRAKPLNNLELQFLMNTANFFCLQLYNRCLFENNPDSDYLQKINKSVNELKNGISKIRASELANNYDFMQHQEKAHKILTIAWSFINHLRDIDNILFKS